jgi:hypothetical protein
MMNLVLGLWLEVEKSGVLLRHSRARAQDLEFGGVSEMLPRSDSFDDNGSTFGKLSSRSAKLLDIDRAASSSGEEVIFLGWLLRWCCRRATCVRVLLKDLFGQDCIFSDRGSLLQKLVFFYPFSSVIPIFA